MEFVGEDEKQGFKMTTQNQLRPYYPTYSVYIDVWKAQSLQLFPKKNHFAGKQHCLIQRFGVISDFKLIINRVSSNIAPPSGVSSSGLRTDAE